MVKWKEYEVLRDSVTQRMDKINEDLKTKIEKYNTDIIADLTQFDTSVGYLAKSSEAQQAQLATLQNYVTTITQQLAALTTLVTTRLPPPEDHASASVHNGNQGANFQQDAYEIGIAHLHGRGAVLPQARRVPNYNSPVNHKEDDGLGRDRKSVV